MSVDNKTYRIDRFDHLLTEQEYDKQEFMDFSDIENSVQQNLKLFHLYISLENQLTDFLIDISLSLCSKPNKIKYKTWKKAPMDFYLNKKLDTWKLEKLLAIPSSQASVTIKNIESEDEYRFLIELALREKTELKILINQTVVTFDWDLGILFQCIDKNHLQAFCFKHNLFIVNEWYRTFWNE